MKRGGSCRTLCTLRGSQGDPGAVIYSPITLCMGCCNSKGMTMTKSKAMTEAIKDAKVIGLSRNDLRVGLQRVLSLATVFAQMTRTKSDDLACSVLSALVNDDAAWEDFCDLLGLAP